MERGSVVRGSGGYKSDEPAKGEAGVTCGPLMPVAGALEGDVCWHRAGDGERKKGAGL